MATAKQKRTITRLIFMFIDVAFIAVSMLVAALLAERGKLDLTMDYLYWLIVNLATVWLAFFLLGINRIVVTSIGIVDALRIVLANVVVFAANVLFCFIDGPITLPMVSIFSLLFLLATGVSRFYFRLYKAFNLALHFGGGGTRVIIVGAGKSGSALLREIQNSEKITYKPVCFVDDDESLIGGKIGEVKIMGATDDIPALAEKLEIEEIIIAMPSASKRDIKRVLDICRNTGCKVKTLPGIYQLVNGEVSVGALRDVEITDLLGREQVTVNLNDIMGYIEGETVLVTGGGGSIGSELCRQIASHNPRRLIIVDIYENNAYDIEQELKRKYIYLDLVTLIASVRDKGKMNDVFDKYRPTIVFNAAAHKHVPLMETSPNEAVKNNVFGTLNAARCADEYGVKTFVQISTDKAVNPTNVMGATKRICEMIIQTIGRHSKNTKFVAVRFGNVLGSNGSVIPLFKKQIAEGGPVTVTHRDIIRYFMTIPEAVSLVLQAGAYAKGGQIFVLDMGEPVRIYDLAYNLIKLSGLEPDVDIEIRCTGLRPGEKLFEERLMDEEGLQKTENGLINIANPIKFDEDNLWNMLDKLYAAAYAETNDMKHLVAELVPTYKVDGR